MGTKRGDARLYGDDELQVLWLTRGRHELALSSDGIWLRRGRHNVEFTWAELNQVQGVDVHRAGRIRIEVFDQHGHSYGVGPFPGAQAQRWLLACLQAAVAAGQHPLRLDGAEGFAFP